MQDKGLLQTVLHAKNSSGLTPAFMLCEQGFDKQKYQNQNDWHSYNTFREFVQTQLNEIGEDKRKNEEKQQKFDDFVKRIRIMGEKTRNSLGPIRDICVDNIQHPALELSSLEFDTLLGINKGEASKSLVFTKNGGFEIFREETSNEPKGDNRLKDSGLVYTRKGKMKDLVDVECRRPSRCFLVRLLLEYGADFSISSEDYK